MRWYMRGAPFGWRQSEAADSQLVPRTYMANVPAPGTGKKQIGEAGWVTMGAKPTSACVATASWCKAASRDLPFRQFGP